MPLRAEPPGAPQEASPVESWPGAAQFGRPGRSALGRGFALLDCPPQPGLQSERAGRARARKTGRIGRARARRRSAVRQAGGVPPLLPREKGVNALELAVADRGVNRELEIELHSTRAPTHLHTTEPQQ